MEQIKQGNHSLPPNLLTILQKLEKTFTKKSDPVFLDENAKKLTMKDIHNKECVGTKPITMIAVSRHQYDVANFPKYINYIKNTLKKNTIYYGLYPDDEKVEYDVLYAIPTNDYDEIQKHLNAHDHMNNGVAQIMGLTISQDGKPKATKNAERNNLKHKGTENKLIQKTANFTAF